MITPLTTIPYRTDRQTDRHTNFLFYSIDHNSYHLLTVITLDRRKIHRGGGSDEFFFRWFKILCFWTIWKTLSGCMKQPSKTFPETNGKAFTKFLVNFSCFYWYFTKIRFCSFHSCKRKPKVAQGAKAIFVDVIDISACSKVSSSWNAITMIESLSHLLRFPRNWNKIQLLFFKLFSQYS